MRFKIISIVPFFVIFLLWYCLTESEIIKPLYLPRPQELLMAISDIGIITLVKDTLVTAGRVILGFTIGASLGITLGLLMSYSRYIYAAFNNIIESWRPVPPVALIPFFILWFGFSTVGKILLVALGSALILVVNTVEAVRNVRPVYIRAAYSLGASRRRVFRDVILRSILPELKSGLRIALAISVGLVIVSEFMGADSGIGYRINLAKVTYSIHTILLSVFILGSVSWTLDLLITRLMDRLTKWAEKSEEAIS